MITTVLIDDEKNALEVLQWQLQTYCAGIHVMAACTNPTEGIAAIQRYRPDLIFLDIEMPKKNGFEILLSFPEPFFDTIFTTAYNQFAVKAFKAAAFDYLLKPIDAEDLVATVQRYEKNRSTQNLQQQLTFLLQQFGQPPALPEKVPFTTATAVHFIQPGTIVYCESSSNYTILYFADAPKLVISKTLSEIAETLGRYDFYRVHHSFLINLRQVERYVKTDGGYIEMTNGSQVPVSRKQKEEVLKVLVQFPRK